MIEDSVTNTGYNLLYKVPEGYHILPPAAVTQDTNMFKYRLGKGCKIRWLYQKDGSRFKVLQFSKKWAPYDIVEFLSNDYDVPNLISEAVPSEPLGFGNLCNLIKSRGLSDQPTFKAIAYWTHTFLNGFRIIPVLIDTSMQRFYDLVKFYRQYTPEDDLGILIEDIDSLTIPGILKSTDFRIISYLSTVRLCPKCGVVSDINKPKEHPWLYYTQTGKYQKQTEDNLGNGIFVKAAALRGNNRRR
jgi:hypothetical protein